MIWKNTSFAGNNISKVTFLWGQNVVNQRFEKRWEDLIKKMEMLNLVR